MSKRNSILFVGATLSVAAFAAGGSVEDKPQGFRFFNQHLTIKPYVSLTYSYDSNIDTTKHGTDDNIFGVEPGADFEWRGERWNLTGNLWYRYNYYCNYNKTLGENSYGEQLKYSWASSDAGERGWTLMLGQRYAYISQSDSITYSDGRGLWRDRERFDFTGVLERRFTERWHADINGQYDWLDYKNDTGKYAPLYGWSEYSGGLEGGFAASKWTDFLLAGGYAHYLQKAGHGYRDYSNESQAWTVQGGIGSRATEKISYRALIGASWFEYGGNHGGRDTGWTYSLSANWRATRQLQFSVLGSSHYQPSERALGTAVKVYSLSGGVSYLTLGDKLNLNANIGYRHEQNVVSDRYLSVGNDYDEDIISARIGGAYTFNRWVSVFADLTWEEEFCDYRGYDYDRFYGRLGVRFHY